jgi:hypothetical protein
MGIVAIIPIANMAAANTALQATWGPISFSVPAYSNGNPSHACLHAWGPAGLITAIKAQPGVVFDESVGRPGDRLKALLTGVAQWGNEAPLLPTSGNALANTLYRFGDELWWCIQTFNRTTFNLPPSTYPALIRRSRRPGEILPWVQPIDQFDAYKVVNPFSGVADQCTHLGQTWRVSQGDGAGNNVFEPGVFGWVVV